MNTVVYTETFNQDLTDILSLCRDVTLRDGVQSRDANRLRENELVNIAQKIESYGALATEHGVNLAPIETWGGGQVGQPAAFSGINPFDLLRDLNNTLPSYKTQLLYRGRQALGFDPVSDDVQRNAIISSVENGISVIRCFDMMNDIENLAYGISVMKELQRAGSELTIEGAVSYMAPADGDRPAVWSDQEYAKFALKLAQQGANEIVVKDYAGQLVEPANAASLFATIRQTLDQNGYQSMAVNLHSHGQKADVLAAAVKHGSNAHCFTKVDTAFGELSNGSSHTNIRDVITLMMREKGHVVSDIDFAQHPLLQAIEEIEQTIAHNVEHHLPFRKGLNAVNAQEVRDSRMAGGAVAALWSIINTRWDSQVAPSISEKNMAALAQTGDAKIAFFKEVLGNCRNVWEEGGQFNTVTPGAKIAYEQALAQTVAEMSDRPFVIGLHSGEYKAILMGRWGGNLGMEKAEQFANHNPGNPNPYGDLHLRNAYLIESGLKALQQTELGQEAVENVCEAAGINPAYLGAFNPKTLENFKQANYGAFVNAIEALPLYSADKQAVLASATPGPFAAPTLMLADGMAAVSAKAAELGVELSTEETKEFGLVAVLTAKNGDMKIGLALLEYQFDPERKLVGSIEPRRDVVLTEKLEAIAQAQAISNKLSPFNPKAVAEKQVLNQHIALLKGEMSEYVADKTGVVGIELAQALEHGLQNTLPSKVATLLAENDAMTHVERLVVQSKVAQAHVNQRNT